MPAETGEPDRRREIVDACLRRFIEKGLYETTSRDLTDALNMRPSALYYHFKNKDDAVLECAEEAAIRLEEALILPVLNRMDDPEKTAGLAREDSQELRAMIRFVAQVCTANRYREQMQPVLARMRAREAAYCEEFAKKLGCAPEELAPWFFAVTASTQSYMIFGERAYSVRPQDFMKSAVRHLKGNGSGTLQKQIEKDE